MPDPDLHRKLSAIMFTDIVGYSKMMELDETATLSYLKFHKLLIYLEVEKHAGKVIKTVGDAFLADFSSAVNAVRCAVTIQRRLHEHDFTAKEPRQVRIGIHVGDVVIADNDIFGDGVNIAARLQAIADPGTICVSEDVYHNIKSLKEFKTVYMGPKELKNVSHKVDVYKIVPDLRKRPEAEKPKGNKGFWFFLILLGLGVWFGARWYFTEYLPSENPPPPPPTPVPTIVPVMTPTEVPPTYTPTPEPTATPVPKPRVKHKPVKKAKPKPKPKPKQKPKKVVRHKVVKHPTESGYPESNEVVPVIAGSEDMSLPEPLPTPTPDIPPPPP